MSEENVEVIRRAFEEWVADQNRPPGALAPDLEWDMSRFQNWPGDATSRGPDGFMEMFRDWVEPYEEWTQDLERVIDAGDEQVLVVARQRGRLRGADAWVELRYSVVYTLESGQIHRAEVYSDPEEALEAAGLQG
jgi:ketosteroid isomerase-like protein